MRLSVLVLAAAMLTAAPAFAQTDPAAPPPAPDVTTTDRSATTEPAATEPTTEPAAGSTSRTEPKRESAALVQRSESRSALAPRAHLPHASPVGPNGSRSRQPGQSHARAARRELSLAVSETRAKLGERRCSWHDAALFVSALCFCADPCRCAGGGSVRAALCRSMGASRGCLLRMDLFYGISAVGVIARGTRAGVLGRQGRGRFTATSRSSGRRWGRSRSSV
jgi:hypothetical protein